jgi:2-hydroxychromene-2-carboxylate isomerase
MQHGFGFVSQASVLADVLIQATSLSAAQVQSVIKESESSTTKAILTKTTEEAVAHGAYGAPTLMLRKSINAEPVMIFGSDRMHIVFQEVSIRKVMLLHADVSSLASWI